MSIYKNLLALFSAMLLLSTVVQGYNTMFDLDEEDDTRYRRDGYYSGYGLKSGEWEFNGIIIWIISIIIVIIILAIIAAWIVIPFFIFTYFRWGRGFLGGDNRRPIENGFIDRGGQRRGYSNDRFE